MLQNLSRLLSGWKSRLNGVPVGSRLPLLLLLLL